MTTTQPTEVIIVPDSISQCMRTCGAGILDRLNYNLTVLGIKYENFFANELGPWAASISGEPVRETPEELAERIKRLPPALLCD